MTHEADGRQTVSLLAPVSIPVPGVNIVTRASPDLGEIPLACMWMDFAVPMRADGCAPIPELGKIARGCDRGVGLKLCCFFLAERERVRYF